MDETTPYSVATCVRPTEPRTYAFTNTAVIQPRRWAKIGAHSASLAVELRPALTRAPEELTS